ncbi:hypothetical protein FGIG_07203 [Fasciola gigantica]|uniref:UPAR/Ly6 domain-containing protein n=1 Tax=Fasciola gigantica TaxID=46835 RepID=A0A504YUP9_FASGI|nr:hypothetical protein FGIG_07203 [Fasciola gigantica]
MGKNGSFLDMQHCLRLTYLFYFCALIVDAQITCYECMNCPRPFSTTGTGVSSKKDCKYCRTEDVYNKTGALTNSKRTCVTNTDSCVNSLNGINEGVTEISCCRWNTCNMGSCNKPTMVIASVLVLGATYTQV